MQTTPTLDPAQRTASLRALIRKHKRWDALFGVVGVMALMLGILTLAALFAGK